MEDSSLWVTANVGYPSDELTRVKISGDSRTEVEGITAQLQELGDELLARGSAGPEPVPSQAGPAAPIEKDRWWNNPWLVTIVGGAIGAVIAAVVVAIILS